ncbi:MAG: DUF3300 domain-containing protein, partial [Candidatus Acidiferrum sp.]
AMHRAKRTIQLILGILSVALLAGWLPGLALGQDQVQSQDRVPPPEQEQAPPPEQDQAPPPNFSPEQLDNMVSRIALYPDPLLAQILAGATYPDQIPDAAKWADEHHYLRGEELANAISADQLPWDPSVQALLPFPSVLDMMASDMNWTTDLGNAFLAQRQDVMDAVQRMRRKAWDYGYLRSNAQVVVSDGPYIAISPVNAEFMCVPYYDPVVVFAPPLPGFFIGGAIRFGYGVTLGIAFRPWGWGFGRFDWGRHEVFINNRPWGRVWANRRVYVHPYPEVHRWAPARRVEGHELIPRNARERDAARTGHARVEEHRHENNHGHGGRP